MSAGMAYEAMNNAGAMNSRLIVVLNDNDMSIAPPVGAMSAYLSRLYSGKTYRTLREAAKQINKRLPKVFANRANRVEEYSRGFMMDGGTLFEMFASGPAGRIPVSSSSSPAPLHHRRGRADHATRLCSLAIATRRPNWT